MNTRRDKPLVLRSLENQVGTRCADLFRRADGTFGFEEYRRDPEDPWGWDGAAGFADRTFASGDAARAAAGNAVDWLTPGGDA
ncbi:MAG: hypothetical protein VW268_09465 [Rhodospirillaceae bacterium]